MEDHSNTLVIEQFRDEMEALLEKVSQDVTRIDACVTRLEELINKSPESEEHRQDTVSETLAQSTTLITQQITNFLENKISSKSHQVEEELEKRLEKVETFTHQKKYSPLFFSLSFVIGMILAILISTSMYTDHLRKYQDPIFLQYSYLGKSLIDVWSQLTQKERDKITDLTLRK